MKRRPSTDLLNVRPSKRTVKIASDSNDPGPLTQILEQYGLLETLVSNLFAKDLFSLALTSKTLHELIALRPTSLKNLLGKLSCSGHGVRLRKTHHQKSRFFFAYDCTEYVQCGSQDRKRAVPTKPCVNCMISTCDECRIHCVYQSIYEKPSDPNDPAELPNFSGFVLLGKEEQPILSPHHLLTDGKPQGLRWEDPSTSISGPYHDQGHLDVALEEDSTAPAECITTMLDLDLGSRSLATLSESSFYDFPSPVVRSLCEVAEGRKIYLCDPCFKNEAPKGPSSLKYPTKDTPWLKNATFHQSISKCQCTLRQRFLDRWLCIGCYQNEYKAVTAYADFRGPYYADLCRCGGNAEHKLCLWCWGEIKDMTTYELRRA